MPPHTKIFSYPDYSVFMSSKAVKLLFDTAKQLGKLEKLQLAVANTTVMSVGPKTSLTLEAEGIKVNHQPTTYSSVGVGEEFTKLNAVGKKVIVPRSGASTPFLKELLSKIGIDVLEIHLYDVCAFRDTTQWNGFRELFSQNKVDGVVFTSASSVRGFFEIMSKDYSENVLLENLEKLSVVSIGPFTSDELKKFKVKNSVASKIKNIEGIKTLSLEDRNILLNLKNIHLNFLFSIYSLSYLIFFLKYKDILFVISKKNKIILSIKKSIGYKLYKALPIL